MVLLQILQGEDTAALLDVVGNGATDGAAIKGVSPLFRQSAVGPSEVGLAQYFVGLDRSSGGHEDVGGTLPGLELFWGSTIDPAAQFGANGHSFFGKGDGRGKDRFSR